MLKPAVRVAALAVLCTATVCSTGTSIVVAPPPAVTLDSADRAALALTARVTARRGLKRHDLHDLGGEGRPAREVPCFARDTFFVCESVDGPEVELSIGQTMTTGFAPWADSVRAELLDSLRAEFGASRVRECKEQRRRRGCPSPAPPGDPR
jgi:hypothetical protein